MDAGLFATLRGFKITSRQHRIADDDFVDRLNHYHTAVLICILSIIICAKQYVVGEPLQCWIPKEFIPGWENYAENYCWVKNTYYIPANQELPTHAHQRNHYEIKYYQWVPFVLGLQALLFVVPRIFWQLLNYRSGINIVTLLKTANEPGNIVAEKREESLDLITRYITNGIFYTKNTGRSIAVTVKRFIFRIICCGNEQAGSYLITTYIVTKLLFLLNIVCQFLIMNSFLGTNYTLFGLELLHKLSRGQTWEDTAHFPRVTYCDFKIRSLGQVRPYTLQCVLVINLFNEKVYIFLWFWFVILFFITAFNTIKWIWWLLMSSSRKHMIKKVIKNDPGVSSLDIDYFMDDLSIDGMFVLKLIGENSSSMMLHDLIRKLFNQYRRDNMTDTIPSETSSDRSPFYPDEKMWAPTLPHRAEMEQ